MRNGVVAQTLAINSLIRFPNGPDTDGFIRGSTNHLSRLDATNTGVDVYGALTTTAMQILEEM